MVFSPMDVGIPVHRQRSYCVLTLKSHIVLSIPFARSTAADLVFQKVVVSAKLYFRAPQSLVSAHCKENEKECRREDAESSPRRCLTDGQLSRLDEHIQHFICNDARFACINYAQNLRHMKFDQYVPALTTTATVWGKSFRQSSTAGQNF